MQKKLFQILLITGLMGIGLEKTMAEEHQGKPLYEGSNCSGKCVYILDNGAKVSLTPKSLKEITAALASNIQKDTNDKYSSQVIVNGKTIFLEYEPAKD